MLTCDMDMYVYAVLRLRYITPACLRDGRAASRCTGGEVVLRGDGSGMLVLICLAFSSHPTWYGVFSPRFGGVTLHDSGGGLR
jgi:hypothetical protein